jgi:hypothetical protein
LLVALGRGVVRRCLMRLVCLLMMRPGCVLPMHG